MRTPALGEVSNAIGICLLFVFFVSDTATLATSLFGVLRFCLPVPKGEKNRRGLTFTTVREHTRMAACAHSV